MVFEITYSLLFALAVFLILRFTRFGRIEGLSKWDLSIAFAIKCIASLIFIYIFTWHYGEGVLYSDSFFYIMDSKILNAVFYNDLGDFLKLFSGIGETEELILEHLSATEMWSRPFNFLNEDTKNIIRLNSIISFFSFNVNFIHFIIFDLFALAGIVMIFNYFKKLITVNPKILFYALVLFPSMLFWGSGVLKEPLLIFAIGLFFSVISFCSNQRTKKIILLLISIYLLLSFKAYVALCFILPICFYYFANYLFKKYSIILIMISGFLLIATSVLILKKPREFIVNYISVKQFDFENITRGGIYILDRSNSHQFCIKPSDFGNVTFVADSFYFTKNTDVLYFNRSTKNYLKSTTFKADSLKFYKMDSKWVLSNSYLKTTLIKGSFKQLLKNIPQALINALFRPFPTDTRTKFNIPQFLETVFVFGFLIVSFYKRKRLTRQEKSLVISLLIFVVSLSLIIGWTTTVAGAIVRYRIPVYLALIILSFIIYNPSEKWKKKEITS
jgi:hypothetical protein